MSTDRTTLKSSNEEYLKLSKNRSLIENCRPKRIQARLNHRKFISKVDNMPSYEQIRNYIYNRKKLIGDNNDIDQLRDHLLSLAYREDLSDEEMFVFGQNLGNGDNDNHFLNNILYNNIIKNN